MTRRNKDALVKAIFQLAAGLCIAVLGLIMIFLFVEGIPVLQFVSLDDFIFGKYWYPTSDPADFGIFPMIVGSLVVTGLSSCIAIPLGIMTSIYLAELAGPRMRAIVKPLVEMLQALPSVVIGFFGMVIVAPWLQETFDIATGLNILNASVMLAFMAVPTITSIAEDAIYSVSNELREASLALGATKWQTIKNVVLPAALPGMSTAVILGMARSIGETMVVLMVAGGAAMIPNSIFSPVRPMPSSIAAEMAEAPFRSEHYHALFATGLVLFLFTLMFNALAAYISEKKKQVGASTL
ncbi:MAG: phosphate ABC transporter permease subunit PstC [Pseudomonadota bacterium]